MFSYFLSLTSTSLLEIVVCSYALKVLSVSLRADLIKSNNSSLRLSNLENLISCLVGWILTSIKVGSVSIYW